ncbi:MAG TPA: transcriptional repressor NrdR [Thermopetrobacter sp.]|nr:transcriptional repressor NrdR [Thermopetrobacter sp.]
MRCPFCASENTQVKDSRPAEDGAAIRRRRECAECGARFTTYERVQLRELVVIKRDGRKAAFERDKLSRSIHIALRKRDVDEERVERLIAGIVRQLETRGETEIPSSAIGELVMEGLKKLDDVAFVRYASVYRNFTQAEDFRDFLSAMTGDGEA